MEGLIGVLGVRDGSDGSVLDVSRTSCVVVGGGPAGAVLSLLLARSGVEVTLLESHGDFDRQFRGESLHPSVLEIMGQIGLADRLHKLPHTRVHTIPIQTEEGPMVPADLRNLRSPYPYLMLMRQDLFLEFVTTEAARYPNFRLVMGANVRRILQKDGRVEGVRYRAKDGWHEVRSDLTVAADGRNSKMRRLAELEAAITAPPLDVLWFRLPRVQGDSEATFGRIGGGHFFGLFRRTDHWNVEVTIPKDGYSRLKEEGIEAFRGSVVGVLPEFSKHLEHLRDWKQVSVLSVRADRLRCWHRPGLLAIGDAAHVMSPAVGVGINLAIQDAVVAANVLAGPLLAFQRDSVSVGERPLAEVQRRRELPVRFMQALQGFGHRTVENAHAGRPPVSSVTRRFMSLPGVRNVLARIIGIGLWRVRVRGALARPASDDALEARASDSAVGTREDTTASV